MPASLRPPPPPPSPPLFQTKPGFRRQPKVLQQYPKPPKTIRNCPRMSKSTQGLKTTPSYPRQCEIVLNSPRQSKFILYHRERTTAIQDNPIPSKTTQEDPRRPKIIEGVPIIPNLGGLGHGRTATRCRA
eukprot:6041816-Pyramimonas_sp.AAC.1